jgi:hypothetical protein
MWTGFIWLRIGTSGGILWTRWWKFGLHKRRGISWLAKWLLVSLEGLCSMELVSYLVIWTRNAKNVFYTYIMTPPRSCWTAVTADGQYLCLSRYELILK